MIHELAEAAGVLPTGNTSYIILIVEAGNPCYHCPKIHAQFQVGEEEAHRPGEGLTKGLDKLTPTVTSTPPPVASRLGVSQTRKPPPLEGALTTKHYFGPRRILFSCTSQVDSARISPVSRQEFAST